MVTASVAVNVARSGEEPGTEWLGIVGFGTIGELLAQHEKGDVITAIGHLTRSAFTDRDGQDRLCWSLLVEGLLSARTTRDEHSRAQPAVAHSARPRKRSPYLSSRPRRDWGPPLAENRIDDLWREPAP